MSQKNAEIKVALDAFDVDTARALLRDALREADAETYYLASRAALDDHQKQEFLEKAIDLDPFHDKARAALKLLHGEAVVTPPDLDTNAKITENNKSKPQNSSPTSTSVKPPPTLEETPRTQNQTLLRGVIGTETALKKLPYPGSLSVSHLRKEAEVYLFERDDYETWYQVLYDSPLGKKVGWIEVEAVKAMYLGDQEVVGIGVELPITEYDGYTREEVKEVLAQRKQVLVQAHQEHFRKVSKQGAKNISVIALLFGSVMLMASASNPDEIGVLNFFLGLPGLLYGVWWLKTRRARNAKAQDSANQKAIGHAHLQAEVNRLNGLQKSMRSDVEVMRDEQRWQMYMSSALSLGSGLAQTAARNYIPDRKQITIKRK